MPATVLESFSGVADGNGGAAVALLTRLSSSKEEGELKYSVGRLVKGTASARQVAREGFFSTLSVLLASNKRTGFAEVFAALTKELHLGGQSKAELSEICIGHILVCGAILRSGLFVECSDEEKALVISTLFNASEKKSYLGIAAHSFIADFIKNNSEDNIRTYVWPHLEEKLTRPIQDHNLDSLYSLLVLNSHCPDLTEKFFKKNFDTDSIFHGEIATIFCEKLMNVPEFSYVNHPIYDELGKELVKSQYLLTFWTEGLEKKLSLHNENRVLIALTILSSIFKNIKENVHQIPQLLGDKFIPCILECFRGFQSANKAGKLSKSKANQYYVHESKTKQIVIKSKEVFENLTESIKKDNTESRVKLEVLNKLLFYPGDIMFCDITNMKIIKTIIEDLQFDSIQQFAEILKKVISNESKKQHIDSSERYWTNYERLRAAEMLTYLINHKAAMDNTKWRVKNMQFLIKIGLFKASGYENSYVSSELAGTVKKCFFRCLTCRLPKLEVLLKILNSLTKFIDTNLSDQNLKKNESKFFQEDVIESWNSMKKFIAQLNIESESHSKANAVFQILALHCGLFLFSDLMDLKTSQNSLREVQSCYEHYKKDGVYQTLASRKEGDIVDDEPEWTEVLVDIFLSFLSRDSSLLRNVVQVVFRLLCEYLTPSAVGQILSVLDPDDEANLLSYRETNFDKDEEDSEDNEENDKEIDAEDSDESESDGEDIDNSTVTDQLRLAVRKALGTAAPETDTESVDIDNMDEDEGNRLDTALSEAFKHLKQSKSGMSKKEKRNAKVLMEFRIRSLDLIHIYLEKVQSMDICLAMVQPLFKCLEYAVKDSTQKPLEDKVRKCLKCLMSVKTFSSIDDVTIDSLADCLSFIISRGTRTQFVFQALGDVISKFGTFIVRCSQKLSSEKPTKKKKKLKKSAIVQLYTESLESFFTKRDCLLPVIFFHDILQTNWIGNWLLLDVIVERIFDGSVRQFRRNEGLEMINVFYTHIKRIIKNDISIDDELQSFENRLSDNIVSYLKSVQSGECAMTERYFTIMMKMLVLIKNYHIAKHSSGGLAFDDIASAVQEYRRKTKLKNFQEYHKFCNVFGIEKLKNNAENVQNGIAKLVKNSDTEEETDPKDSVVESPVVAHVNGKDNKKNRVKQTGKREAKHLRMLASSQGMGDVSFTSLLRDSNMDVSELTAEPDLPDKKAKKRTKPNDDESTVRDKKTKR